MISVQAQLIVILVFQDITPGLGFAKNVTADAKFVSGANHAVCVPMTTM